MYYYKHKQTQARLDLRDKTLTPLFKSLNKSWRQWLGYKQILETKKALVRFWRSHNGSDDLCTVLFEHI